jgi:hypothetical protein
MARTRTKPSRPDVTNEDLRQHLTDHAAQLRSLAATVRERGKPPVLEEYVRSGRGPAYRRAEAEWFKTLAALEAFDDAAARFEEALAYSPRPV